MGKSNLVHIGIRLIYTIYIEIPVKEISIGV